MPGKMVWDEIIDPLHIFNGSAVGVQERIEDFTPHLIIDVITLS